MKITKTIKNMATKRGFSIIVNEDDRNLDGIYRRREDETVTTVEFAGIDEDGETDDEYAALYRLSPNGLFFLGSCRSDSQEWPHWIEDEATLKGLLDAMAVEIVA